MQKIDANVETGPDLGLDRVSQTKRASSNALQYTPSNGVVTT